MLEVQKTGYRLKTLREFNNLSQEYVASKLNISQAAYSKIENGGIQLSIENLVLLAELYKISPNEILGFSDKWQINNITNSNGVASSHVVINMHNEDRIQSIEKRIETIEKLLKNRLK